jgi:DNA modification methylase
VTVDLRLGDCREVMRTLADSSVDAIVTDPPYHLTTGKKGGTGPASVNLDTPQGRARVTTGFMGMTWDGGDVAHDVAMWAECLRVLKPGGHLLAFSGTRTYHRMVCAIEDAGFEIRDQIGWSFGSGFPKSHNGEWGGTALKPAWEPICMARKPLVGTVEANWRAHGTGALNIDGCRVAVEDDSYARNFSGDRGHDGTRDEDETGSTSMRMGGGKRPQRTARRNEESDANRNVYGKGLAGSVATGETSLGRWPANLIHDGSDEVVALFPREAGAFAAPSDTAPSARTSGIYGAMKRPGEASAERRYAEEGGTDFAMRPGARRLDTGSAARFFKSCQPDQEDVATCERLAQLARSAESRCASCGTPIAADPAETRTLDSKSEGSPATPACTGSCENSTPHPSLASADNRESTGTTPTTASRSKSSGCAQPAIGANTSSGSQAAAVGASDPALATRFLYCPKASREDRNEGCEHLVKKPLLWSSGTQNPGSFQAEGTDRTSPNHHPTVKPTDLMRYLCRLVTPKGGMVLDPFAGSGSTGKAAVLEGFAFMGIELSAEYLEIARARIDFARRQGHQPSLSLDAA